MVIRFQHDSFRIGRISQLLICCGRDSLTSTVRACDYSNALRVGWVTTLHGWHLFVATQQRWMGDTSSTDAGWSQPSPRSAAAVSVHASPVKGTSPTTFLRGPAVPRTVLSGNLCTRASLCGGAANSNGTCQRVLVHHTKRNLCEICVKSVFRLTLQTKVEGTRDTDVLASLAPSMCI